MGLKAFVDRGEGIDVPDGRSIEPLGIHGLVRLEKASISKRSFHNVHEVGAQVEVHPLASENVGETDIHISYWCADISQLSFKESHKFLVVVETALKEQSFTNTSDPVFVEGRVCSVLPELDNTVSGC